MSGCHKYPVQIVFLLHLSFLTADCVSTITFVDNFYQEILNLEFKSFDSEKYSNIKSELRGNIDKAQGSDCENHIKDSLEIVLYMTFSENVARSNGDFTEYRSAWEKINGLCKKRIKTLNAAGTIDTVLIDHYTEIMTEYYTNDFWLKNNFADLIIIMDNIDQKSNEMGVVKNEINKLPVSIDIQPPLSIRNDFIKTTRLEFIKSEFKLDFTSYDPKIGFIKKITDLPIPDPENETAVSEEIFESLSMTFDGSVRYRVDLNEMGIFDTLRIRPEKDWYLSKEIPDDIVVINMPTNWKPEIIDSKSNLIKKDVRIDEKNRLIIRNNKDENIEIIFQKRINIWKRIAYRSVGLAILLTMPFILNGGG